MASIEERAEEFADAMVKGALGTRNGYYDSYIKGAIDQRKRDVEKAYHFIKRNTTLDRWVNVDAIAEQLRKAMEEDEQ